MTQQLYYYVSQKYRIEDSMNMGNRFQAKVKWQLCGEKHSLLHMVLNNWISICKQTKNTNQVLIHTNHYIQKLIQNEFSPQ